MTEPILNIIFFDGEKEYQLNEIENKQYFKDCYGFVYSQLYTIIELINDSDAFVYIDTSTDRNEMFKIKNQTEEIKIKLKELGLNF
ncbi:MAG: hypothetical protein ACI8WA_000027 [Polaribacter sp.]|jgi:hypothetical protein